MLNAKRNMRDIVYSTGKTYGHGVPMVDAHGHVVHEGDEVFLLYSNVKKVRYIIDEINSHIAYLRPLVDNRIQPFPVLSNQIVKARCHQGVNAN